MRKIFALSILCLSLFTCDDGDIITSELEFDDTFRACGDLVIYKTNPSQSLTLQITGSDFVMDDLIETEVHPDNENRLQLINTEYSQNNVQGNHSFRYRSYASSTEGIFCNDVPPDNIQITEDYISGGDYTFYITLIEDDNDGIPAYLEDLNGNGDLNDDDTDGDGIPNYMDIDDDGDNVLTTSEGVTFEEGMTLAELEANALDTDGDGIPNYRDADDDGDGTDTIDEENVTQDNNPTNDVTNPDAGPDYLNDEVSTSVAATAYRIHTVYDTFVITLVAYGLDFGSFQYQTYDFGTLTEATGISLSSNRTLEP
ncbi:MAG TPA: hypothetical protein EYO76_07530 [Flavobacteriaceae bacterium]|nr:hypothetical protein [Flavobacteriaceae bacterium]